MFFLHAKQKNRKRYEGIKKDDHGFRKRASKK